MGIARRQFDSILTGIFTEGNTIKLFSTVPNEQTESGGVNMGQTYKIQSGDFSVSNGVVQSAKNMMFYLCETAGGDGIAKGFGVYQGTTNTMLYFGSFKEPMTVGYNTVPTIKKYDASKGEGVRITMTSTEVEATATSV